MLTEESLLKPHDAKEELDMLYAMLEQPWQTSTDSVITEKKLVTFEGIGPIDDQTGVPLATRTVSTDTSAKCKRSKTL